MKDTNRGPKLGIVGLIVLALLLGVCTLFVAAVFRKVQANRAASLVAINGFEGFVNYASPFTWVPTAPVITESRIEHPVFSTRTPQPRIPFWVLEWKSATTEVLQDLARTLPRQGRAFGKHSP